MSTEAAPSDARRGERLKGAAEIRPFQTLAESVAAEIHRLILTGEFAPGEPLRIQELAELFRTSSMPVREALRQLSATGIVDMAPHRGARVAQISLEDLEDTFGVRFALEPLATSLAAERMSPEQLLVAEEALEEYGELLKAGDVNGARRAHEDFHFALYYAAGSKWLMRAIDPVWQNTERYRFAWADNSLSRRLRAHDDHRRILETCRAGDGAAAAAAMQDHLDHAYRRIRAAILHDDEADA